MRRLLDFQLTRRALQRGCVYFRGLEIHQDGNRKSISHPARPHPEVVYNAIDERFLRGHATEADRQFLAERYQVTYPFLLYAGRISPHKNMVRIIEAFSALKAELEKEAKYPGLKLILSATNFPSIPICGAQ